MASKKTVSKEMHLSKAFATVQTNYWVAEPHENKSREKVTNHSDGSREPDNRECGFGSNSPS